MELHSAAKTKSELIFAQVLSNGVFAVMLDFGNGVFNGEAVWLQIAVQTNGGSGFTELSPRQQFIPTPYAIFAGAASNLVGPISPSQLPAG